MSKLGLAFSGTLAALALGAMAATALAQQPSPGPDGPRTSPMAPEAGSRPDTGRSDGDRMDRDRRDWRDEEARDRGPRSWRDRRDYDDFADRRRWRYDGDRWSDHDQDGRRRWREGRDRWREHWDHHHERHGFRRGGGMGLRALARLCRPGGDRMMGFLLDRLERITQPTQAQRASFDRLREAAGKAHDTVRAACPAEPRPITPPGRMAAAEKRLEALLAAVRQIRPALDEYYGSLSEEQKARLYAARGRAHWRHGFDRWRERDWERRGPDGPRRGSREGSRQRSDNDRNRGSDERSEDRDDDTGGPERWRDRDGERDRNSDGWPDRWRGPS